MDDRAPIYRERAPHPALAPFVDRIWISSAPMSPEPRPILPDGCVDLLIDLQVGARALAVGTMTRPTIFAPVGPVRTVAVRFRPGGAAPWLPFPLSELTDRVVGFRDLGLDWLQVAPLEDCADLASAARLLEASLLRRLPHVSPLDPLVEHALRALLRSEPPSIDELGRRVGWSRQHLRRVFDRRVGVGPKQFARVARMQRAVLALNGAQAPSLAALARGLGYFDQAHLGRDLRELAGITAVALRAARGSIFPIGSVFGEPNPGP